MLLKLNIPTITDSSSFEPIKLQLEPVKNKFIKPTFEEFKAQKFAEHEQRLMFLMTNCPQQFIGCEIKKVGGRNIKLFKDEVLFLELFNHEVFYERQNNDLIDFLKKYIPEELSKPYIDLPKTT